MLWRNGKILFVLIYDFFLLFWRHLILVSNQEEIFKAVVNWCRRIRYSYLLKFCWNAEVTSNLNLTPYLIPGPDVTIFNSTYRVNGFYSLIILIGGYSTGCRFMFLHRGFTFLLAVFIRFTLLLAIFLFWYLIRWHGT